MYVIYKLEICVEADVNLCDQRFSVVPSSRILCFGKHHGQGYPDLGLVPLFEPRSVQQYVHAHFVFLSNIHICGVHVSQGTHRSVSPLLTSEVNLKTIIHRLDHNVSVVFNLDVD